MYLRMYDRVVARDADTCDLLVNIPMTGKAESLNAGVAGSIALYEIARHR